MQSNWNMDHQRPHSFKMNRIDELLSRLRPQESLHGIAPNRGSLVPVDVGDIALFQPVDRRRELLSESFLLDGLDGVRVRMERKHQALGARQPMERLAFAA